MDIIYPRTLPKRIIDLAGYYGVERLRAFPKDPFVAGDERQRGAQGKFSIVGATPTIDLYLSRIFKLTNDQAEYGPMVGVWLQLLETTLHEIAHQEQVYDPLFHSDYKAVGYQNSWPERNARAFARKELLRLADLDENLFMPKRLKDWGYLGVRISRWVHTLADENRDLGNVWHWGLVKACWQAKLRAGPHIPYGSPMADRAASFTRHRTVASGVS